MQHYWLLSDKTDVGLAIVVVAYDAAEGKEQDGDGHYHVSYRSYLAGDSTLCELYARLSAVDRHPTHQDDEGSARAHHQRVGEYTQCLYQSLLHRVRHMRCGSSVWRRTFTSLIAEQSPLDTLHHSRTKSSAQVWGGALDYLVPAESPETVSPGGHGVGMSQYGAAALAEQGFDAEAILKHYYTGVTLADCSAFLPPSDPSH